MLAGLALALGSALGTNVAFLFSSSAARCWRPRVQGRHPLRSAVGLFRSRWFSLVWALAASLLVFYASARGLQLGPGVAVIAFTSVAANLAAIMGGILLFRNPIGIGALPIVGRVVAFGLVIAGAALMPAPLRASEATRREV